MEHSKRYGLSPIFRGNTLPPLLEAPPPADCHNRQPSNPLLVIFGAENQQGFPEQGVELGLLGERAAHTEGSGCELHLLFPLGYWLSLQPLEYNKQEKLGS